MTIIFLEIKYGFLEAYKNIKNHGLSFVFAQKNAARCISGQNKWLEAEHLQRSLVDARKRAIRLEVKGYRLEAGDYSRASREN